MIFVPSKAIGHGVNVQCDVPFSCEKEVIFSIITALDAEKVRLSCEIDLLITDDETIRAINLDMRKVDKVTDVLSFPMLHLAVGEHPKKEDRDMGTYRVHLGDMCICLPQAERQAEEYGHGLQRELCYLAVHSVLHLLGYDHLDEGEQKRQMRKREEEIMEKLGLLV